MNRVGRRLPRWRWAYLAPVLALLALMSWAFASPVGAGPDDDYHLISTWCAAGGSPECLLGSAPGVRSVDAAFRGIICFAGKKDVSAECQQGALDAAGRYETDRGNFAGEYPPVYYAVMHLFAGSDIQASALVMRVVNAALFVGLTTALFVLLSGTRRSTLLWGWLIAVVPLGMFLIPSNNPSGWAVTGVGTAFLALMGWFETDGRRRWVLASLYLIGVVMAAGSRGDAGVYVVGATVTAVIITGAHGSARDVRWILPLVGVVVAAVFFIGAGQSGVAAIGFSGGSPTSGVAGAQPPRASTGLALAAYNLLMLPFLWTGVWGTWALGWFDTGLPAIVPWAATAAFIVVAFAGLGKLDWRKAISAAGVLAVLIVLPVYVLTVGGMEVGQALQPRYLLPLILLLSLVLATVPSNGTVLRFTRIQTVAILGALSVANLVALQVNIRRYVTGADQQGPNLDAGAEWWWTGFPLGPTAVWLIGALAFVGLLAAIRPVLRSQSAEELTEGKDALS